MSSERWNMGSIKHDTNQERLPPDAGARALFQCNTKAGTLRMEVTGLCLKTMNLLSQGG